MATGDPNIPAEIWKATIEYVVPVILVALFNLVGPIADFAWKEIFLTKRVVIVLVSIVAGIAISPSLAGWIVFAVFVMLVGERLFVYIVSGPKTKRPFQYVFAGFYALKQDGRITTSGESQIVEKAFVTSLRKSLEQHFVHKIFPFTILEFKPPKIVHSRYRFDSFERLMMRYTRRSMGVIWGFVDSNENIKHLNVVLRENTFSRPILSAEALRYICSFAEDCALSFDLRIGITSNLLAALWGQSYCDILSKAGKWKESLFAARHSKHLVEVSLELLNPRSKSDLDTEKIRRWLLPPLLREEAYALLNGGEVSESLNTLLESTLIDPYWPLSGDKEFTRQYEDRYAQEISQKVSRFSQKARVPPLTASLDRTEYDPNLELLLRWFETEGYRIADLDRTIDLTFVRLSKSHPTNPFVFMYWAEALKIPQRIKDRDEIQRTNNSTEELYILPLSVADAAINRLEIAYKLAPSVAIISARLFTLYLITLMQVKEGSKEYKRRSTRMAKYARSGREFLVYKFPEYGHSSQP